MSFRKNLGKNGGVICRNWGVKSHNCGVKFRIGFFVFFFRWVYDSNLMSPVILALEAGMTSCETLVRGCHILRTNTMSLESDPLYQTMLEEKKQLEVALMSELICLNCFRLLYFFRCWKPPEVGNSGFGFLNLNLNPSILSGTANLTWERAGEGSCGERGEKWNSQGVTTTSFLMALTLDFVLLFKGLLWQWLTCFKILQVTHKALRGPAQLISSMVAGHP